MDELLTTFLGQCVTILVLNQSVEVEVGDALSNAGFANVEVGIFFNALPKIAFENSEPDVTLILDFVLVNDVEDHVIILVQFVHGVGVFGERFEQQERNFSRKYGGFSRIDFHELYTC